MDKAVVIHIRQEADIITARKTGREIAQTVQFSLTNQARILTVVSELSRNIYRYAGSGQIEFQIVMQNKKKGIKIISTDKGSGIPDLSKVMKRGYSTSGGLGAGLPGVKAMMDEFNLSSSPGSGTRVETVKWQEK
ncbi:MAG: anti-sigma regulatory factor [Bacillota bacterium]